MYSFLVCLSVANDIFKRIEKIPSLSLSLFVHIQIAFLRCYDFVWMGYANRATQTQNTLKMNYKIVFAHHKHGTKYFNEKQSKQKTRWCPLYVGIYRVRMRENWKMFHFVESSNKWKLTDRKSIEINSKSIIKKKKFNYMK